MGVAATLAPKGFGPQDPTKKNWPIGWTFWVNHHLRKRCKNETVKIIVLRLNAL